MTVDLKSRDSGVKLIIVCGEQEYRFGFVEVDVGIKEDVERGVQWISKVVTDAMTVDPPVGAAFMGMMLGLYTFGELEACLVPADFEYAEFS